MSKKNQRKMRGPSRPIDPRYAPGQPARRSADTFGYMLIGLSTAFVLVIVLLLYLNQTNSAAVNTSTSSTTSSSSSAAAPAAQTQQAVASETQQAVAFATETSPMARISAQDAKTLYDAQNVQIIDVRAKGLYDTKHIKGAKNIPNDQAQTRLAEFPKTGNLILYCQ